MLVYQNGDQGIRKVNEEDEERRKLQQWHGMEEAQCTLPHMSGRQKKKKKK